MSIEGKISTITLTVLTVCGSAHAQTQSRDDIAQTIFNIFTQTLDNNGLGSIPCIDQTEDVGGKQPMVMMLTSQRSVSFAYSQKGANSHGILMQQNANFDSQFAGNSLVVTPVSASEETISATSTYRKRQIVQIETFLPGDRQKALILHVVTGADGAPALKSVTLEETIYGVSAWKQHYKYTCDI